MKNTETPSDKFRKKLAALVSTRGTRRRLCINHGINYASIDKWIRGDQSPTLSTVEKVAHAFGIKPDDLLV